MRLLTILAATAATALLSVSAHAIYYRMYIAPWQSVRTPTSGAPLVVDDSGGGLQVSFPGDGTQGVWFAGSGDGLTVSLPGSGTGGVPLDQGFGVGAISFPNGGYVTIPSPGNLTVTVPQAGAPPANIANDGSDGLWITFPNEGSPGVTLDPIAGGGLVLEFPPGEMVTIPTTGGRVQLPSGGEIVVEIPQNRPFRIDPDPGVTTVSFPAGTNVQVPVAGRWVRRTLNGSISSIYKLNKWY